MARWNCTYRRNKNPIFRIHGWWIIFVIKVVFQNFGESFLDFELRVWIANADERLRVASDLRHGIARRFREKEIEIAFPQRDLHVRSAGESPGSILKPPEDKRPDLAVVPRKEKDDEDEKGQ